MRRLLSLLRKHKRRVMLGALALALAFVVSVVVQVDGRLVVPVPSTMVTDRYGVPLTEVGGGVGKNDDDVRMGYWPLPDVMPMRLSVATRETEDRRYFEHGGVSWQSLARAIKQNISERRVVSGASTIAMQVARMQGGRRRSVRAKLIEMIEATLLVRRYGHDAVLRQYLTLAPYGARVHGAERAARFYFDKPAADLSWKEAAWLAGLPQQPTRLGPFVDGGLARGEARAHRTLRALHARGYLNDAELEHELHAKLSLADRRPRPEAALHFALRMAEDVKVARRSTPGLLRYRTSLDLTVQRTAHGIVRKNLARVRPLGATNSAALVLDSATGEVLAWVGSAAYDNDDDHGQIDYLTVKRSPGSTLKPFLYALAFDPHSDRPLTAAEPLADVPLDVVDERGRSYTPTNINRSFLGPMSARTALGNSRNIPALRVLGDHVGITRALAFFKDAGVRGVVDNPEHYGLGLALGNLHVTALELATLYLSLRHSGAAVPLRTLAFDSSETLEVSELSRILDRGAAELVTHILADPQARVPSFAEGSPLDYDHAVAVKTGTSQGYRDGWTVAFSDRLLVVMWVGNHDWRRMNHLGGVAGTADAVHELIATVTPRRRRNEPVPLSVSRPAHSEAKEVCALSGELAGPACPHRHSELFLPGTAPTRSCAWHDHIDVDVRTGDLATPTCAPDVVRRVRVLDVPAVYHRWARQQRVPLMPTRISRLCGGSDNDGRNAIVALVEPHDGVRLRFDPNTPTEQSTIRLAASVSGADDDVVFLVNDEPIARAAFPYEVRHHLSPGEHSIRAVLARSGTASAPIRVVVR